MCGITARVGTDDSLRNVVSGLENLEYRGYDSAGVAIKNGHGLEVRKREGEIADLKDALDGDRPHGSIGIGHTRWSTHGPPTDENAHPHTDCTDRVAVVHNGIVENHSELKAELLARGHEFDSGTDTEVVPHLVEDRLADGATPEAAFRAAIRRLEGSYAVAMVVADADAVFATRRGSPLVLGVGADAYYLASDVPAFLEFTDRVVYLDDGDLVVVTPEGHRIADADGDPVDRPVETVDWVAEDAQKGGYDHYMLKEIFEQPAALQQSVEGRIGGDGAVHLEAFPPGSFEDVRDVQFVAAGTSYHAAMYGRRLLGTRGIDARVFRAGEYATDPAPAGEGTLAIAVTQSGETADTLESLRNASATGARTLALTNVVGSTASREADDALFIRAGPEIGVAATKTFSSQVATVALLAERLGRDVAGERGEDHEALLRGLRSLPRLVDGVLDRSGAASLARQYRNRESYFFIGRGVGHPVALEGALKFKEITYEHAEGFAAGQLKHGPLALVTHDTPVFAVFAGSHEEKTLNNVQEVKARGAPVVAVAPESASTVAEFADDLLAYPDAHPAVAGVLANVQLQLVSYHVADLLGRSIDKPRNLAKSVTVE